MSKKLERLGRILFLSWVLFLHFIIFLIPIINIVFIIFVIGDSNYKSYFREVTDSIMNTQREIS